jgi:CO/xanthine dehydrogenase Mo-binding subunit
MRATIACLAGGCILPIDPGLAVQPRNVEAQTIGAITQGISHALFEQINIVDGEVQESNPTSRVSK